MGNLISTFVSVTVEKGRMRQRIWEGRGVEMSNRILDDQIGRVRALFGCVMLVVLLAGCGSTPVRAPSTSSLRLGIVTFALDQVTSQIGWVFDSNGVHATVDGGSTWMSATQQGLVNYTHPSYQGAPFTGFAPMGDLSAAAAVVAHTTVYVDTYTVEGGRLVVRRVALPVPSGSEELDLTFQGGKDGWLFVDPGTSSGTEEIFHTTDGGHSWALRDLSSGLSLSGVTFMTPTDGVGAAGGVAATNPLYATTDGGQSWHPVTHLPLAGLPYGITGPHIGDILSAGGCLTAQVDESTGMFFIARFLNSHDGGKTWTLVQPNPIIDEPQTSDTALVVAMPACGVLEASESGVLWRSANAGSTWYALTQTGLEPPSLSQLSCATSQDCWAITTPMGSTFSSRLEVTHDGGASWSIIATVPQP